MSLLVERAGILAAAFRKVFECDTRPFGNHARGVLGISDGAKGVQWNAWYRRDDETYGLGVNLEGLEYDGWPVARLIEREMSHPRLLTEYRDRVPRPDRVRVSWKRDAWQFASRVPIKGSSLSPTPIALDRLDMSGWIHALERARECLNPERNYRGRRRTTVTLLVSGNRVEKWVTPHLHFGTSFNWFAGTLPDALQQARENLTVLREFARRQAAS